ncbi:hypothetical protein O181_022402 [Austropuccinia psidii MF-1]|uniref:Uncharacterized protein n=1 Tax=Austropuccinia psidii MF-1 TaxID=1389203 RepID=A0A9Q3CHF6_9BASI|nr:hypothetical protein [Austropuccinia psidii MF-1]
MTIAHKAWNIHKDSDGLRRWELSNTPHNPAFVPLEAEQQTPIEVITINVVGTELLEEVRESFKWDNNCHILTSLHDKYCKDTALFNSLDEIWRNSNSKGIFNLF